MSDPEVLLDAFLDGDMEVEAARELGDWLASDPANVRFFVRAVHVHRGIREHFAGPPRPAVRTRSVGRRIAAGAAAAAMVLVSWILLLPGRPGIVDDFEHGAASWIATQSPADGEWTLRPGAGHDGSAALEVFAERPYLVDRDVPVRGGTVCPFSLRVRIGELRGGRFVVLLHWMNERGGTVGEEVAAQADRVSEWIHLERRIEAPPGASKVRLRIGFDGADVRGRAWVDDVRFLTAE